MYNSFIITTYTLIANYIKMKLVDCKQYSKYIK